MMSLLSRIVEEKRPVVLPLAIAIVANLLAYSFIVYPLGVKSAGSADRASAAAAARQAAEREEGLARALVTGKSRADDELNAFYQTVLPLDQSAARRMTYASLPALAKKTNVRYEARKIEIEDDKAEARQAQPLGHLVIHMTLQGQYADLRDFIYQLESAPQFVIIDNVTLMQATGDDPLTLTIELSTYFRQRGNGA
jgi:hypothetical protein